jgi:hypothetical protein
VKADFDPTDPSTWGGARAGKKTGPRRRYPRTAAAVNELVYALEGARFALSALEDPDYFEKYLADQQEKIGREIPWMTANNPRTPTSSGGTTEHTGFVRA